MYRTIKIVLDKLFALLAIILLLPLFIIIMILIKGESKGKSLIKQKRVGYKQKIFYIYKFRTMYGEKISFDPNNPVVLDSNSNVTKVGKVLRKTKLDELPQLYNILKGEMSFIGTRPLMPCYLDIYEEWELSKFKARPGLSGLAQINGNGHLTTKERSYYDIIYEKKQNIFLDIKILLFTVLIMIYGERKFIKTVPDEHIRKLKNYIQRDTKSRIKVAQIIGNVTLGGVANLVLNYCKEIDKDKIALDFFIYGEGNVKEELKKLGNVIYLGSFINFAKNMIIFNSHLKIYKYDIIHSHLTTLSFFPLFIAMLRGVKIRICHSHSSSHKNDNKKLIKNLLRPLSKMVATHYIACSKLSAKWFFKNAINKTLILNNAIDLNKFKFDKTKQEELKNYYNLNNKKVIGFVGRFVYPKNNIFMLKIIRELIKFGNYHLVLLGDGKDKKDLLEEIEKLEIRENVTIIPPQKDVNLYYNLFDAFLMTSFFEGLPLVAIEALANELPLILSDKITEELKVFDNVNYISLNKTPAEWANIIFKMSLTRKNNLPTLNAEGFNINKQVYVLQDYYTKIMEKKK